MRCPGSVGQTIPIRASYTREHFVDVIGFYEFFTMRFDTTGGKRTERGLTLRDILERDDTIAYWLRASDGALPTALLLLARRLGRSEREWLREHAGARTLDLNSDLPREVAHLREELSRLESLALTDPLTSLYNFRFFERQLEVEMRRTRRTGMPLALMMLDLDNFKQLNDTRGHQEGNRLLVAVAGLFADSLRPTDVACRFGGDEFAVIMPATRPLDAKFVAGRIRQAMAEVTGQYEDGPTFSIGIATFADHSAVDAAGLIAAADRSLYRAKQEGKNRVCMEGQPAEAPAADAVTGPERSALFAVLKDDAGK